MLALKYNEKEHGSVKYLIENGSVDNFCYKAISTNSLYC